LRAANWVALGPGSRYTSAMTHLLVPDLKDALRATRAKRVLVLNLNLDPTHGETEGLNAPELVESFRGYAPDVRLDVVIADPSVITDEALLRKAAAAVGADLLVTPVSARLAPGHHDPLRLAAAFQDLFAGR